MTATRPVPAPDIAAVASRILPAGAPPESPGLTPPSQDDDDHAHLNLPAVITAARDARHFTTARMTAWDLPPRTIQAAQTIVTELITNAYQAASSAADPISLSLRKLPGQVVIEVSDNDPRMPAISDAADDDESGRGLLIIETVSDEWGYHPRRAGGKVIHAIIRIPP